MSANATVIVLGEYPYRGLQAMWKVLYMQLTNLHMKIPCGGKVPHPKPRVREWVRKLGIFTFVAHPSMCFSFFKKK